MGRKSLARDATGKLFGSIVDILLWQVFLTGASFGKTGPKGVRRAFQEADESLGKINHKTIAAAWHQLTKKQLLTRQKRGDLYSVEITRFGKERLARIVPQYASTRPWDGKIYLITFDIPEDAKKKRDRLRHFLRSLQCVMLQKSVWLTPYNPRTLVKEFADRHTVPGTIIISDIGKDGGVGETTVTDMLVQLYHLEELNDRYAKFLNEVEARAFPITRLVLHYLNILRDDPQLPFPLLPSGWLGEKAYQTASSLQMQLSNPRSRME